MKAAGALNNVPGWSMAIPTENLIYYLTLGMAVFHGFVIRFLHVQSSDFPLNDGGMFLQAIEDIQQAGYRLPQTLNYNFLEIPFAYSPLGFYAAALIADISGASLFTILRYLPLTISVLTIAAFILLAKNMLQNRTALLTAAFTFALLPRSYNWEIMGGGLTRSFGFLFAVLGLWQAYLLFTRATRKSLVLTSLFGILTCLSHIEMALFMAFSSALMLVMFGTQRRAAIRDALIVAASVALVTSPWWGLVLSRHGIGPFLNASRTGSHSPVDMLVAMINFNWTDEPLFPLLAVIGLVGVVWCLHRGSYFLPLWLLVCFLLDPRKYLTDVTLPIAMLVGIATANVLLPLLTRRNETTDAGDRTDPLPGTARTKWVTPAVVGVLALYAWLSSMMVLPNTLVGLTHAEREAMAWISQQTPPESSFAVVTNGTWARDRASEWFPVIAERRSVATVQGYEWLPDRAFEQMQGAYQELQECGLVTSDCLDTWSEEHGIGFSHVILTRTEPIESWDDLRYPCCTALELALAGDNRYQLIYQNADVVVFERIADRVGTDG